MNKHKSPLIFITILFWMFAFLGCDSDTINNPNGDEEENNVDTTETYNYTSDYAYNVNVIYFTPNDVEPLDNYHSRLSGFLLYVQDYYKQWMEQWGYDNTTFGLLKDDNRVKITHIEGDHPVSAYPNDGGGYTVREEIRIYFDTTSNVSPDSKHYLVFMPQPETEPEGGLPYYGIGRWGFVIDVGQSGSKAENDGGGAAHELGHGLNLPHISYPKSQKEQFGTALMGNGNNVWNNQGGSSETSLSEVSATILSVNQVFSKEQDVFYGSVNANLTKALGTHENGTITIAGEFESDVPVYKAVVILDPEGGAGYNQIGWTRPVIESDSFYVEIPTNELFDLGNTNYNSKVWLIHENGQRSNLPLEEFSFNNGIPDISFHYGEVATLPKDNWDLVDFSDEEPTTNNSTGNSQVASNIIDGNFDTFWHSQYSDVEPDADHPHYFTVDMGSTKNIDGFQFVQREGISAGAKRVRIKDFSINVSSDGENWEEIGDFTLNNVGLPQQVELNESREFRYFKIVTSSSMYDGPRASLAEVGVY